MISENHALFSDKWYNKELKEQFITELSIVRGEDYVRLSKIIFDKSSETESVKNKDLCLFNKSELIYFFENVGWTHITTTSSMLSIVKRYINFCNKTINKDYPNLDVLYVKPTDIIGNRKNKADFFLNIDEFIEFLYFLKKSEGSNQDVFQGISVMYSLYYLGATHEDIYFLKEDKIDYDTRQIVLGSKVLTDVDERIMKIIKDYQYNDGYVIDQSFVEYQQTGYLIKWSVRKLFDRDTVENAHLKLRGLVSKQKSMVQKLQSELPITNIFRLRKFSPRSLTLNGYLNRVYELEKKEKILQWKI